MILREGLQQFPENEELLITLANVLYEAGRRCLGETAYLDDDG